MQNSYRIITGCLVFLLLHACDYPCGKASTHVSLIAFQTQESDTIIVRRFAKGNNFKELQDSLLLDSINSNFLRRNDTLSIIHHGENEGYIVQDYDYEIYVPDAGKTYQISEVTESFNTGDGGCKKVYCVNGFQSYKINGTPVSSVDYATGIPIKK